MARIRRSHGYTKVTLLRGEVMAFKARWPASGLPDAAIWFEFSPGGDLVDMGSSRSLGRAEGSGALLALSHDAQALARRRRRVRWVRKRRIGLLGY